jgi:hypothetical protein
MRRHILCNRGHRHRTDGVERLTHRRPKLDMSTRGPSHDLWPRLVTAKNVQASQSDNECQIWSLNAMEDELGLGKGH